MNKLQVIDLLEKIKRSYPNFDVSPENVEHFAKYLRDFPYEIALENIEQHILAERFPPTIADIRGRLGDQLESQRSKDETAAYFAQLENWRKNSSPPPDGYFDRLRAHIRGGGESV